MNEFGNNLSARRAAANGLAIAGFIALVIAGMWLAVYSSRFVPTVVNRIGTAAVYVGSVFTPAHRPSLAVVPAASSTIISFGQASTTISTPVTTPTKTKPTAPTTAGSQTTATYPIGGTKPVTPYGLPDLTAHITAIGYLATTSASSFVANVTVPAGSRPAVAFTIKNIGTNTSGSWRFSATIPTQTSYLYQSEPQQSLAPGDSIDYVLGFDQANRGANQLISINVNFDRTVTESNTQNNADSMSITILGN